jgi:thioredoxin-related protein
VALGLTALAQAADAEWLDDFDAAKAKAEKDGKDLLVDFTGSDWCGWCVKLKSEVFSQEGFKTEAPKSFVLVELDFPRKKELPAKLKQQNEKLVKEYQVEGYPTILLADAKGRAYAKAGYQAGGPAKYMELLGTLRAKKAARDEAFAKADKASGIEKAKLLDQALMALEKDEVRGGYMDVMQQIVELDADNKAGLKMKYVTRDRLEKASALANAGDVDKALASLDAFVNATPPTGEAKQEVYFLKGALLFGKKDKAGALAALQTALEAAPKSERAGQIGQILGKLKAEVEKEKTEPAKK